MEALFLLIAVSLLVALGFLGAFIWAVRSRQYEDDFTPSVRILFEGDTEAPHSGTKSESTVKQRSK
jgi:cbb3-type cytochrome oxidase maturation protein